MTLDGKPVTLEELERQKKQLQESPQNSNDPPKKIVEVSPGEFKTKTQING